MTRRVGPVKVRQYSVEFKLEAVKLSQLPGVEVQAVADAHGPLGCDHPIFADAGMP